MIAAAILTANSDSRAVTRGSMRTSMWYDPISSASFLDRPHVSPLLFTVPMYTVVKILSARSLALGIGAFSGYWPMRRVSAATWLSPAAAAATASWHMVPTMAAVAELSAPPERGSRKPDAPDLRRGGGQRANTGKC